MVGFENTRGVCSLEGEKEKQEGSSNMIAFTVGIRTEGVGTHADAPGPTERDLSGLLEEKTS